MMYYHNKTQLLYSYPTQSPMHQYCIGDNIWVATPEDGEILEPFKLQIITLHF